MRAGREPRHTRVTGSGREKARAHGMHAVMVAGPEKENESEGSFAKGKVRGKMRTRLIGHLNGRFIEGKKR